MSNIKHAVVRAFKKNICHEMGRSNSSEYAIKTLPLAADLARALGFNVIEFLVECGFSANLLADKGYLVPSNSNTNGCWLSDAMGGVDGEE
jgi:hypothetical protein